MSSPKDGLDPSAQEGGAGEDMSTPLLDEGENVFEVTVEAVGLDENDFVVDIVQVREVLDRLVERYRDSVLNDLPEFDGVNTGCEVFSRVAAEAVRDGLPERERARLSSLAVRVWESEEAWASYRVELNPSE